jgi:preprotein translocase subunit YajC
VAYLPALINPPDSQPMSSLLDFFISPAAAQVAGPAQPSPWQFPIMMVVLFGLMFVFMIRPQMKRQKEVREMLGKLAKGDEVLTNGGLAGRIDELGEHFVTLEIATGVKVKLQRSAISAVLPKNTLKSA